MITKVPFDTSIWHWRFAYLPKRMDNGQWVWLGRYRARYVDVRLMAIKRLWLRHLKEDMDW